MEQDVSQFDLGTMQGIRDAYEFLVGDVFSVVEDITVETRKARKAMDYDPVDMNLIATAGLELSILNQRLGDRVWQAGVIERASKNHYETVREGHKVRLVEEEAMAAGVADSHKVGLAKKEFELSNDAKGLHDKLQYLRKSTDKTIDMIRSKNSIAKVDYGHS